MKKTFRTLLLLTSMSACIAAHAQGNKAEARFMEQLGNVTSVSESLIKQSAYFEANQVVRRFFLCIPEASNHKHQPGVLEEVEQCFNEIVDADIEIDIGGKLSHGRESALAIATQGLASIRQNASFSLSAPYISEYQRGRRAGTGTIALNFNVLVHQEITSLSSEPQPFDPTPGPQLFVSNNTLGLKAVAPGKWKITLLKVNPLLTQRSPDIVFHNPFPNYPIQQP